MSVRVFIIRHGETNENANHIIQGQLDTMLNEAGIKQARFCHDALKDTRFCAAFSSDLQRAVDTARIILESQPDVQLQAVEALRERHMGELQGRQGNVHGSLPASVESSGSIRARLIKFWRESVEKQVQAATEGADVVPASDSSEPTANILLVSHGGTISVLLMMLFKELHFGRGDQLFDLTTRIWNASISKVDVRRDGSGTFGRVADISHMLGPVVEKNADVVDEE
ncbi:phosphoglycerate mutase-like protein [Auriculariales sp. MPI-PUGE-AT-0066]|nr:phosphoglycerate mutase-like protein [Auriculariales sp. MPI-PUGE-AT-0066]